MKKPSLLLLMTVIGFACHPGFAAAQSETEPVKKPAMVFTCVALSQLPVQKLYYKNGTSYLPVELRDKKRSPSYPLGKAAGFALYMPAQTEQGGTDYKVAGTTPLPAPSSSTLFILMPGAPPSGLPLRIIALDDSLEGFPAGSFRFANFSASGLLVKVKDKVTKLEANTIAVTDSCSPADGGLVPLYIGNLQSELRYFTRLYAHPRSREIIFIGKSNTPGKKFEFLFIPQNVPVAEKAL